MKTEEITAQTAIESVISDPDFTPWGRLIFPADSGYWSGEELGNLTLTWYSRLDAAKTVEIVRYFKNQTLRGEPVFFDIYTEKEKTERVFAREHQRMKKMQMLWEMVFFQ